jgi:hypothetical protein
MHPHPGVGLGTQRANPTDLAWISISPPSTPTDRPASAISTCAPSPLLQDGCSLRSRCPSQGTCTISMQRSHK